MTIGSDGACVLSRMDPSSAAVGSRQILGRLAGWIGVVEVQDDAEVLLPQAAQAFHRGTVCEQDVMHGAGGGADVAVARRMDAHEI